ncbi:MAG: NFACT family protein [Nanoarchaeota archaeon]|nr:NFACT family protein [Nanoarchaeota archaeon]
MKSLTSIEIAAVVKELKYLEGAIARKIYQPDNSELLFELFKTGKGKSMLRIVPGKTLYLTSFKRKNPLVPLSFVKFLRKRAANSFLEKIEQKGFERIVEFTFKTKTETYYMIAEFFSKGNVIFCNDDHKIISALQVQLWKDRKIKANETYKFPPKANIDIFKIDENEFKKILKESKKENIVKTLAVDIGLGGLYSEELCLRADIDKNKGKLLAKEIHKLFNELKKLAELELKPFLFEKEAVPFDMIKYKGDKGQESPSFNGALDNYYKKFIKVEEKESIEDAHTKKIKKYEKIIEKQKLKLAELEKASKFNKDKGDLIYKNYIWVKDVLDTIKKARSKNVPWKEIEEKLKTKKIIVKGKMGQVILDLK